MRTSNAINCFDPQGVRTELRPGTRVDDFTVAYRITRGMNADVFAVWHHGLGAPLVCKRLRPEDAGNKKWRRLLLAEGAALARLRHPGVVSLVAQNRSAALPYLLLEHVGSRTLRDELRERGSLPVDLAARVVQHTGAAVAYMHGRGYLHRDIKPSNIILRQGRPVLLDFGVVWRLGARHRPPDRCGTPQRLAPEQIRRETLTPATDVYGLGTLLFELLTGNLPFAPSDYARDHDAALEARYTQLTRTPHTLAALGCDAPAGLQELISHALSPNHVRRFTTVSEFLVALDRFTEVKIYPADLASARSAFSS